jgi:hypothetical protein
MHVLSIITAPTCLVLIDVTIVKENETATSDACVAMISQVGRTQFWPVLSLSMLRC